MSVVRCASLAGTSRFRIITLPILTLNENHMKKILYIGGFELPDKNAAAQRVIANARLLSDMGYEVSFIGVSKDIESAPSLVFGFKSAPVKYPRTIRQWFHQIFTFVDFDTIKRYSPDYVILYNFPSVASLRILMKCHKSGIKVIHDLTEWEEASGWNPRDIIRKMDIGLRMRYCMKKMDGVIAISRYLYDCYSKYTQCILVPPTVDLDNPKFMRGRSLEKNDGTIRLVYAGSAGLSPTKDRLDLIIKNLKNYPTLRLDIIGMNEDQYARIFNETEPIPENVVFHGRLSHQDAVCAVCNADFQMLVRENTRKNNAGFPTKFVESMSCCTPLIATRTSNICDYLQDGVNGFVVDDTQSLDKVFKRIIAMSNNEITALKNACREFEGFDFRNYKDEFKKLFN